MIINATGSTLRAAFAAANGGDTIKVTGSVGTLALQNRLFSKTVVLDATNASFTDSLTISGVSNLTILNGTFGSWTQPMRTSAAIGIYTSSNVIITKSKFIGNGTGVAIRMGGVTKSAISAALVNGFKAGIGLTSVTDTRISSSRFVNMTSDGIDIADSHGIEATSNSCYGTKPSPGAHPDCIQLWSIAGNPGISDITLTKNNVQGDTQGLTMFDGPAYRIRITDNIINTNSFPQGIACYDCYDSTITGNQLTTIPGSRWRTSINIVGGANNLIANNSVGALPGASSSSTSDGTLMADTAFADPTYDYHEAVPDYILEDLAFLAGGLPMADWFATDLPDAGVSDTGLSTDFAALRLDGSPSIAAVPEPAIWAQLIAGFGLTGFAARRRLRFA